jgi:hypothetical protein
MKSGKLTSICGGSMEHALLYTGDRTQEFISDTTFNDSRTSNTGDGISNISIALSQGRVPPWFAQCGLAVQGLLVDA